MPVWFLNPMSMVLFPSLKDRQCVQPQRWLGSSWWMGKPGQRRETKSSQRKIEPDANEKGPHYRDLYPEPPLPSSYLVQKVCPGIFPVSLDVSKRTKWSKWFWEGTNTLWTYAFLWCFEHDLSRICVEIPIHQSHPTHRLSQFCGIQPPSTEENTLSDEGFEISVQQAGKIGGRGTLLSLMFAKHMKSKFSLDLWLGSSAGKGFGGCGRVTKGPRYFGTL